MYVSKMACRLNLFIWISPSGTTRGPRWRGAGRNRPAFLTWLTAEPAPGEPRRKPIFFVIEVLSLARGGLP